MAGLHAAHRRAAKVLNIGIVALLVALLVACTDEPDPRPGLLDISPDMALLDEPVRIRVTALAPGQRVELTATANWLDGSTWSASATFRADGGGVVDLDRDAPESGDYTGVDGMGLIVAMRPSSSAPGPTATAPTDPAPTTTASAEPGGPAAGGLTLASEYPIRIAVTNGPAAEIRRVALAPGVTYQELTVAEHGVAGVLFTPAEAAGAGVLLIGGSEGGVSSGGLGMGLMLAARGYPALALGYFNLPDRPSQLRDISVEYFANAATKLPGPVRVVGSSRGSEAAMLLSALYPQLVAGTVIAAPADRIYLGFPNGGYAWRFGTRPQLAIPFDAIAGPVLAIAGTADAVWDSTGNVERLAAHLGDRIETVVIEGAGHDVLGLPYVGQPVAAMHPVTGESIDLGGTRQSNEQARRETWSALLAFLAAS